MKALSVWQPWASLIALGLKHFETRSWNCATILTLPEDVLVCASQRRLTVYEQEEIMPAIDEAVRELTGSGIVYDELPLGRMLCIVRIQAVHATRGHGWRNRPFTSDPKHETTFGDFSPGRWAWKLGNVRRFKEPFPIRGRQGLFDVDDSLIEGRELIQVAD